MPPMAFNTLWFWVFFLVAVAIPSLLAVEQEDAGSAQSTPRNAVWSWPIVFMHSKVIYLNLSTMEYPGIKCIKEYRETWNRSARLLTKVMVTVFTSEEWTSNKMVYNAAAKRRPAQAFTAVNESGSTSYRVAFNYTSEYCAIIKKQNETGGAVAVGSFTWQFAKLAWYGMIAWQTQTTDLDVPNVLTQPRTPQKETTCHPRHG
nr:uncharacterized protein LOC119184563 isoform X2 [Rhipicephalus microplus]